METTSAAEIFISSRLLRLTISRELVKIGVCSFERQTLWEYVILLPATQVEWTTIPQFCSLARVGGMLEEGPTQEEEDSPIELLCSPVHNCSCEVFFRSA